MKIKIKPQEEFDRLSQEYGNMPICRSFQYGPAVKTISWDEINREWIEAFERNTGAKFDESRTLEFTFSTDGIKRDGNRIRQEGWVMDKFRVNPVALWCHDQRDEPIGKSPAQWVSTTNGLKSLRGLIQFTPADVNPRGARVEKQYREGFLNAVSISWNPVEVQYMSEEEMENDRYGQGFSRGVDFLRSEALEISGCPVPADPDALMKRIQRGELDAEEMRLITPTETELDGNKLGVFYIEGRNYEIDGKAIFDFGKKTENERTPEITPDETPDPVPTVRRTSIKYLYDTGQYDSENRIPFYLKDEMVEQLRELANEGVVLSRVTTNYPIDILSWDKDFDLLDLPLSVVVEEEGRHVLETGFGGTPIPNIFDQFRISDEISFSFVLKENTEPEERRSTIAFDVHGPLEVTERDAQWNSRGALQRVLDWARKGKKDIDYKKYRQAFTWGDTQHLESTKGYRLLHHDVVDGKLVTNWRGLQNSAQRVMSRNVDIPEGDWAQVEKHISREYELFGEKAPWGRTLGSLYSEIHRNIRETEDESELAELRSSAVSLGEKLFGDTRLLEPWESRTAPEGVATDIFSLITKNLEDEFREFVNPELFDIHVSNVLSGIAEDCRFLQEVTVLRDLAVSVANEKGFSDFDSKDISHIRQLADSTTAKPNELGKVVERLENKFSKENKKEKDDKIELSSLIDRLCKRVEDKFSGDPDK